LPAIAASLVGFFGFLTGGGKAMMALFGLSTAVLMGHNWLGLGVMATG